jgi:type IV pilus assembly protein PilX
MSAILVRERGMALISGLLLLVVVTILAIGMFRSLGMQARIAGNTRDKQRALHAAEGAQTYAEWWLSSASGANATPGATCAKLLSVTAGSTQVCSNNLNTVTNNQVQVVPWMVGTAPVGVSYTPPQWPATPSPTDPYFSPPLFYISYVTGAYDKKTGTQTNTYQVDATGYGGSQNTVAVVESSYVVSVTYTTQNSKSKFVSLINP